MRWGRGGVGCCSNGSTGPFNRTCERTRFTPPWWLNLYTSGFCNRAIIWEIKTLLLIHLSHYIPVGKCLLTGCACAPAADWHLRSASQGLKQSELLTDTDQSYTFKLTACGKCTKKSDNNRTPKLRACPFIYRFLVFFPSWRQKQNPCDLPKGQGQSTPCWSVALSPAMVCSVTNRRRYQWFTVLSKLVRTRDSQDTTYLFSLYLHSSLSLPPPPSLVERQSRDLCYSPLNVVTTSQRWGVNGRPETLTNITPTPPDLRTRWGCFPWCLLKNTKKLPRADAAGACAWTSPWEIRRFVCFYYGDEHRGKEHANQAVRARGMGGGTNP